MNEKGELFHIVRTLQNQQRQNDKQDNGRRKSGIFRRHHKLRHNSPHSIHQARLMPFVPSV